MLATQDSHTIPKCVRYSVVVNLFRRNINGIPDTRLQGTGGSGTAGILVLMVLKGIHRDCIVHLKVSMDGYAENMGGIGRCVSPRQLHILWVSIRCTGFG